LHHLAGAMRPMPTCAVALVEVDEAGTLGRGAGRLEQFFTPKDG